MPIQKPPPSAAHFGQGVAYPPRVDARGRLALSWGAQSVNDAMAAIVQTEPGERVMQPDNGAAVGIHEPVRDTSDMEIQARQVVAEHEPRVDPSSLSFAIMRVGSDGKVDVQVAYQIIGEATARTLTFPYWERARG